MIWTTQDKERQRDGYGDCGLEKRNARGGLMQITTGKSSAGGVAEACRMILHQLRAVKLAYQSYSEKTTDKDRLL